MERFAFQCSIFFSTFGEKNGNMEIQKIARKKCGNVDKRFLDKNGKFRLFTLFFSLFFQEKREKQQKQQTFPKFANLTEDKILGTLRIPMLYFFLNIWGKKWKYGNTKNCANFFGNLDKKCFEKNGPYSGQLLSNDFLS